MAEAQVIALLQKRGWELQFQRARTAVAEVDLIFQKDNRLQLIEVKSLDNPWRAFERISHRQMQKLILNQLHLSQRCCGFQVGCCVAWVTTQSIRFVAIN